MKEEWRDIEGYEGIYQVSNFGNVKSLNYRGRGYENNLPLKLRRDGYLFVQLSKKGNRKNPAVHRLVAKAFIQNPNEYGFINHKDENKTNNKADNLEWCTKSYNCQYSIKRHPERIEAIRKRVTEEHARRHGKAYTPIKHKRRVIMCDMQGNTLRVFENPRTIQWELGYLACNIVACCEGKQCSSHGYKWKWEDEKILP